LFEDFNIFLILLQVDQFQFMIGVRKFTRLRCL